MATSLKLLAQAQVSTTSTVVYTVPTSTITLVKELTLTNTSTTSNAVVNVYFVKSGESEAVKNNIIKSLVLLPTETQFYGLNSILPTGTTIKVSTDVNGIVGFSASGLEVS
jgi:hypothetical protein